MVRWTVRACVAAMAAVLALLVAQISSPGPAARAGVTVPQVTLPSVPPVNIPAVPSASVAVPRATTPVGSVSLPRSRSRRRRSPRARSPHPRSAAPRISTRRLRPRPRAPPRRGVPRRRLGAAANATAGSPSAGHRQTSSSASPEGAPQRRRVARERRMIRRSASCLASLDTREARFLAAYAGLGRPRPAVGAAAARRAGVPARTASRFRARAVRDFTGARRAGCGAPASGEARRPQAPMHLADLALPAGASVTSFAPGLDRGAAGRCLAVWRGTRRLRVSPVARSPGVTRSGRLLADVAHPDGGGRAEPDPARAAPARRARRRRARAAAPPPPGARAAGRRARATADLADSAARRARPRHTSLEARRGPRRRPRPSSRPAAGPGRFPPADSFPTGDADGTGVPPGRRDRRRRRRRARRRHRAHPAPTLTREHEPV